MVALARAAIALHECNGALSRAPHDCLARNTIARRPSGGAGAFAFAATGAVQFAGPTGDRKQLSWRSVWESGRPAGRPSPAVQSGDQPVDRDDDHPSRAGARVRRSARPSGRACRVARADQMAIVKPSRLGPDHSRRRSRAHEVVDVAPPGHRPPRRTFQRSPASSLSTRRTAFSKPAPPVTARNQERFFASQVTARGPIWPHGTPRPCRSSSSQIPENWANAANSWIPADGRSRTRTWDLFLIREKRCRAAAANAPCSLRFRRRPRP